MEGPWQYRGSLWSQFGNLQGMGRLPLPEKSEAAWGFWVFLCSFCVVGVFYLNSSDCSRVRDEGLRGASVYQQGYFPLLCLCGFVLFRCSRHTQASFPVCPENMPRNRIAPAITGSQKVNYVLMAFIVMKLRKTSQNWMFCGNCPSCLAL